MKPEATEKYGLPIYDRNYDLELVRRAMLRRKMNGQLHWALLACRRRGNASCYFQRRLVVVVDGQIVFVVHQNRAWATYFHDPSLIGTQWELEAEEIEKQE